MTVPSREVVPDGPAEGLPVVLVHGYPQSSRMWVPLMKRLAADGHPCVAPDLYGLGESRTGGVTFEAALAEFAEFMDEREEERLAVVVHDWGGFIGLAWACEHPDRVGALVISDTGFFADAEWHGFADAIRGPGGEDLVAGMTREGFEALMASSGAEFSDEDLDAYWEPFTDGRGQAATLGFYRSMDFEKLAPWAGTLGDIGAPTLIIWGEEDPFASVAGAHRLKKEIPDAELLTFPGVSHFLFDQAPDEAIPAVAGFLSRRSGS